MGSKALPSPTSAPAPRKNLLIVGNPNVGKSVFFNAFTGHYAVVSNYPGTTVELMQGKAQPGKAFLRALQKERQQQEVVAEAPPPLPLPFENVMDTPGMYSLCPLTQEERVSQHILLGETDGVLLHVIDAKNLHRALTLTLQLLELQKPMVLALNLYDEALAEGLEVHTEALSHSLGIPCVSTIATRGVGVGALCEALRVVQSAKPPTGFSMDYGPEIEEALAALCPLLMPVCGPQSRAVALLLLQGDTVLLKRLQGLLAGGEGEGASSPVSSSPSASAALQNCLEEIRLRMDTKTALLRIATKRYEVACALAEANIRLLPKTQKNFWETLSRLAVAPATGIPLLLLALYLGLYQFVGVFGAGVLVEFFEGKLFGQWLLPPFEALLLRLFPGEEGSWLYWLREFLGGDYGLFSLGLKYALAVILPIVASFFFFFSLLEDSGYFPRLALLADKSFKRIGLNGRALIPLVLGVGCGTMATLVTRIQETKRERLITMVLLALAVPCSAQYGVISTLLLPEGGALGFPTAFLWWLGVVLFFFVLTGALLSRLLPGKPASFYMELPPMRLPMLKNVIQKTAARLRWYFWEVLPIFLLASALIWLGRLSGLFGFLLEAMAPVAKALGLPAQTAEVFLFGFFRRDFGAAGLYGMAQNLSPSQILIACVTLTLFLPCIAQFLMMKRERGWAMALGVGFFVTAVALGAGKLTGVLLEWTGVVL